MSRRRGMSDAQRKRLLLAVLAVLAAIFAVTRLPSLFSPAGGGGPRGFRGGDGVGVARVAELKLARLDAEPRDYTPGRDPFRYYQPPPPPKPPPPPPPPVEQPPPPPPPEELGPQPPEITLTYLGSFGPEEQPIAVFTDGEAVYNVLEGEVLEDQFVVARIGLESVDLTYIDFPELPPARLAVGG